MMEGLTRMEKAGGEGVCESWAEGGWIRFDPG